MQINNTVIGMVGAVCTIIFTYLGYMRGTKKESNTEGRNIGVLMSDIGYIKAGVDDMKRKQDETEKSHFALAERVKGVEESAKQAHKRIDRWEDKINV